MDVCCFCLDEGVDRQDASVQKEAKREAIPLDVIMRGMASGTRMYKMKDTQKLYKRKYKVDLQNMRLTYSPTKKRICGTKSTAIDLYDVEEVRTGWGTDVFNKLESKLRRRTRHSIFPGEPRINSYMKEENCFAIVSSNNKVLNLIAPNGLTRDAWVRGLRHLLATCKSSHIKQAHNRWLKDMVRQADVNNNGSLNFNECLALLRQINIAMDRKDVQKLFDSANFRKNKIDGEDALDPDEFVHFYNSLTRRPELEDLMKKYSVSRTAILGSDELRNFFLKEQKVLLNVSECNNLIDHYEPTTDRIPGYLSLKGFTQLMLSVEGHIMNKRHRIIYQDMTHPLSHYYIASSHNTYLLQGQLVGQSSVEGYIQALLRGSRCLELDVWDGGTDDEPIVYHGYTLTTRILFRDVLDSIKEYAFKSSQYPVILSIENHCSLPYQRKMAHHFVHILGSYLYKEPVGEHEKEFPSPEQLARKIIIKAKKLKETSDEEFVMLNEDNEEEVVVLDKESGLDQEGIAAAPAMMHAPKVAQELSDLVNYCSATSFTCFQNCQNSWKFYEMASFMETKALRLANEEGAAFVSYNKKHFSRIYPKGTRTDSSNYDPVPFWNVGCQIVALNYQTWDKHMYLHEAKFTQNGRCGYILKPRFLYDETIEYDPKEKPHGTYQRTFLVKVISGQHLPRPNRKTEGDIVDPYVVIKVIGHPSDSQKKKTSYVQDNGFNPVWNEMFLLKLHMPELAMIWFKVKDQNFTGKNELLGQYAIPFTSIAEGYRHIHLQDTRGQSIAPASLFVHITVGSYGTPQPYKKKT